jgi:hypothetical protein
MPGPTRQVPVPGLRVRIVHLGTMEDAVIDAVLDGGRTLIVRGERYTLRPVNARYVREDEPSYGVRLAFGSES